MRLTARVTQEQPLFVAQCLDVDVASQGSSREAAMDNLKEALQLYFESAQPEDFELVLKP